MRSLAYILCLAILFAVTGCQGEKSIFTQKQAITAVVKQIDPVTNYVTVSTNVSIATDISGVVVTNISPVIEKRILPGYAVTNYVTNTIYEVSGGVTTTLETAKQLNSTFNPTPTAPIINWFLIGLSSVLGLVAKVKSNKAALVPALIAGVEAANNADTKRAIQEKATALGVQDDLHAVVRNST